MKTKEENYIVINGTRYDVVPDVGDELCINCDLVDKCFDSSGCFCVDLYDYYIHFVKV